MSGSTEVVNSFWIGKGSKLVDAKTEVIVQDEIDVFLANVGNLNFDERVIQIKLIDGFNHEITLDNYNTSNDNPLEDRYRDNYLILRYRITSKQDQILHVYLKENRHVV